MYNVCHSRHIYMTLSITTYMSNANLDMLYLSINVTTCMPLTMH